MKPLLFLLCLLFINSVRAQERKDIIITHVTLIPMNIPGSVPNQDVLIRNGRIYSISPARNKKHRNATVIDGTGKFLMPALAEMHAHIPPVENMEPMKRVLTLFLANGITTIRGMLGHPLHLELRSQVDKGQLAGPRIITSGPSLNGNSVISPEAGAAMVRAQKQAGYDFLKLHPGLSRAKFDTIAAAAKQAGIPFAGHVSWDVGVWRAIEAGYATIDHMDGFIESLVPAINSITEKQAGLFGMYISDLADTTRIPVLMQALKTNNIWVVPTEALSQRWFSPLRSAESFASDPEMIYMEKQTITNWTIAKNNLLKDTAYNTGRMLRYMKLRQQLISAMNRSGVGILLGSDAPQVFDVPGFSAHQELQYYVDAGLSEYEALRTGTVNVGRFLHRDDLGVIRTGAIADLLLLDANPLIDIRNTQKISAVMKDGQWYPRAWINTELKKLENN